MISLARRRKTGSSRSNKRTCMSILTKKG